MGVHARRMRARTRTHTRTHTDLGACGGLGDGIGLCSSPLPTASTCSPSSAPPPPPAELLLWLLVVLLRVVAPPPPAVDLATPVSPCLLPPPPPTDVPTPPPLVPVEVATLALSACLPPPATGEAMLVFTCSQQQRTWGEGYLLQQYYKCLLANSGRGEVLAPPGGQGDVHESGTTTSASASPMRAKRPPRAVL